MHHYLISIIQFGFQTVPNSISIDSIVPFKINPVYDSKSKVVLGAELWHFKHCKMCIHFKFDNHKILFYMNSNLTSITNFESHINNVQHIRENTSIQAWGVKYAVLHLHYISLPITRFNWCEMWIWASLTTLWVILHPVTLKPEACWTTFFPPWILKYHASFAYPQTLSPL